MNNLKNHYLWLMLCLLILPASAWGQNGVTATWAFDGTANGATAALSHDGLVSTSSLTLGNDLSVVGTQAIGGIAFSKVQPATSNVGSALDADAITLMITPKNGLTLTPTRLTFKAARFGTNGGKIDVVAMSGSDSVKLLSDVTPNRNDTDPSALDLPIDGLAATYAQPLYVKVYIKALANNKQYGFRDFVVTGSYSGTVVTLPTYAFSVSAATVGAGSLSQTPAGTQFDEGTPITVSVTPNFGYHFAAWTDSNGHIVSTDNPYTFSIMADTKLTATFTQNKVYTLDLSLTNGARHNLVSVMPEGHVVNGKRQYEEGEVVKLTAQSNKILTFVEWENKSTDSQRTLVMDGDKAVTANYSAADYIVGWDLYDDQPSSERAADYRSDSENAGLLSLHNAQGVTTSWLSRGINNGQEEGRYAARIWKKLTDGNFFEISFSTLGYSQVKVSNALGCSYNTYLNFKEQVSLDGINYSDVGLFTLPSRGWTDTQEFTLPEWCSNQTRVYVRWYPVTDGGMTGVASDYDGLSIADIFVTADADASNDDVPPVLLSSNPSDGATDLTINGAVVLNFDEKVMVGDASAMLGDELLQPVVSGKTVVYNYSGLQYGSSYTFSLAPGAITDRYGNAFAGTAIRFTTMLRTQPKARLFDAVVAADGSGDYTSIQAAIDAAPEGSTTPWLIFIKKGSYTGHHVIPAKKGNLSLIGQGKLLVRVADSRRSGGDNVFGISDGATMDIEADDIFLEGIDLINSWGVEQNAGPQALALCSNGDRLTMSDIRLRSYQDTWYTGGTTNHRAYLANSWLEGAVDFVYGKGDVMITNDTINIVRKSGGYIVAPNHSAGTRWGYVFLNNTITAPGVPSETDVWLGRPWHESPMTVFINTKAEVTIPATGWYPTMGGLPALWAEFNTVDRSGNPVDLSHRRTDYYYMNGTDTVWGKSATAVLTAQQAAAYTVKNVCGGDNWNPELVSSKCDAPTVSLVDARLHWSPVPYAICYVVTRGDEVVGFTTETSFDAGSNDDATQWKVQAVGEYGGLSKYGMAQLSTSVQHLDGAVHSKIVHRAYYNSDGRQVLQPGAGLTIVRTTYADGNVQCSKVLR